MSDLSVKAKLSLMAKGLYQAGNLNAAERLQSISNEMDSGWISVNERLPEKYSWYLIVSSTKVTMAFYDGDTVNEDGGLWLVHNDNPDSYEWENVTHWMPLPEPPTK